ncbi:MAG: tetratricopeptide repeat protein [Blastocatellia bacterium]
MYNKLYYRQIFKITFLLIFVLCLSTSLLAQDKEKDNTNGQVRKVGYVDVETKIEEAKILTSANSQRCIIEGRKIYRQLLEDESFKPGSLEEGLLYEGFGYATYKLRDEMTNPVILELYNKALSIYSKLPNKVGKLHQARVLCRIGAFFNWNGNQYSVKQQRQGLNCLLKSLKIVKALSGEEAKKVEMDVLTKLGEHYYYSLKWNFVLALKYDEQALKLYQEAGDIKQFEIMVKIGFDKFHMGKNKKTLLKYFEQALEISRQWGDKKAQVITSDGLGIFYNKLIFYKQGDVNDNLEKGEQYYKEALDICKSINDEFLEADIMENFSNLYNSADDIEKEKRYSELSRKLRAKLNKECTILVK